MNGPEHYREAERLIAGTDFKIEGEPFHNPPTERDVAEAQVHATLALAAATAQGALTGSTPDGLEGMSERDMNAWNDVAGSFSVLAVGGDES